MRISDWSSDVCSSDLDAHAAAPVGKGSEADGRLAGTRLADKSKHPALLQGEGDAVDDGDVLRRLARRIGGGADLEIADVEQVSHRHALPSGWQCGSARSEEHTSELQSLMRISYAVFCCKKTKT